ncbi:hypothetical protein [Streptomyces sp. H39-S7]|uniref:hypothetical protein n=1 Tax=Streptomyces sp. H39-S7 TaxID=3004357 RepID=UPI0022AEF74F|nr:hypothetical protein [Streptomyces sp. H39-S7]MCZ4126094.1 hypothetical protein [Streptomyces sp. H39-S7]
MERAAEYVFATARVATASLSHQFQALFGLSLAEKAGAPCAAGYVDVMAGQVSSALDRECAVGRFDPFAYDTKLLLLCHSVLRERGFESDELASFAGEVSAALREMDVIPARLAGVAHLLDAIGEDPFGAAGRIEPDMPRADRSLLLRAETAEVREVCNRLAGASLFGARELVIADRDDLLLTLPVLLLQKLREYDLILGSSLLRTLKYLGASEQEDVDYATRYLVCQQQGDGRFGYYARELEGPSGRIAAQDLYLPVTVSVLWALAEASVPGLRVIERGRPVAVLGTETG